MVEYARLQGAESSRAGINVDEFRVLLGGVSGIVDGHEIVVGNERLVTRLHWLTLTIDHRRFSSVSFKE